MPWYETPPKPARHYVVRTRRCRQRIAQRLGAGLRPETVSLVERLHQGELATLLEDDGFQHLIEHYRKLASLPAEERRRRLAEAAMELLELGIGAGDLRVAMFVMHEEGRGRDPALSLADAIEERHRALRQPSSPAEAASAISRRREPEARAPFPPPPAPRLRGSAEADYAACATAIAEPGEAEMLAVHELGLVRQRLAATRARLCAKILAELERQGTARIEPLDPASLAARAYARAAHDEPGPAFGAAARIDARRRAFRDGAPPPRDPESILPGFAAGPPHPPYPSPADDVELFDTG
jgi:hypothetical protein